MAKILFSALIDGIRGRSGGVIFSANASGPLVRRYAPPIARSTAIQITRRGVFSGMGNLWRDLSQTQRDDWNTYAAAAPQEKTDSLGNAFYLNGFQWFVSCNSNLELLGRSDIQAAPVIAVPTAPTIGALVIDAPGTSGNSQAITVASFGAHDLLLELNWTPNISRLVAIQKNFLFTIGVQNASLAASIDLLDLTPIFGTIGVGTYWISRVYAQTSEGRRSTYSQATDVAA